MFDKARLGNRSSGVAALLYPSSPQEVEDLSLTRGKLEALSPLLEGLAPSRTLALTNPISLSKTPDWASEMTLPQRLGRHEPATCVKEVQGHNQHMHHYLAEVGQPTL